METICAQNVSVRINSVTRDKNIKTVNIYCITTTTRTSFCICAIICTQKYLVEVVAEYVATSSLSQLIFIILKISQQMYVHLREREREQR